MYSVFLVPTLLNEITGAFIVSGKDSLLSAELLPKDAVTEEPTFFPAQWQQISSAPSFVFSRKKSSHKPGWS